MPARTVMVQGTASHVGKSVLAAALCRWFTRRGFRVAPFKAQNMSNNSYVTSDGKEIGRAQAVQAQACRLSPRADFNPILIKPSGPTAAQLVVNGLVAGELAPSEWAKLKRKYFRTVCEAFGRLSAEFDVVILEGAGSPAEINLRDDDIVNMRMARVAQAPVLLVGDIDRGGVFASLVGTSMLLEEAERRHIRGFIINKFRGDPSLLQSGIADIEGRLGTACLGVVPVWDQARLPEEDSVGWPSLFRVGARTTDDLTIGVVNLPYLSNSRDVEALAGMPGVRLVCVDGPTKERLHLLLFPGTKNTVHALHFVRRRRIDQVAHEVRAGGGSIVGICGGFQLLGRRIFDPSGVESSDPHIDGLGMLDVDTVFCRTKTTQLVRGRHLGSGVAITGYEIHMGQPHTAPHVRPFLEIQTTADEPLRQEGAVSDDGRIMGTSVHGLFECREYARVFLDGIRRRAGLCAVEPPFTDTADDIVDEWTDFVADHLDMAAIEHMMEHGL